MSASRRLEWMDVAKGIAIILMVVGHTTIPKGLSDFIWAFHMPLFFVASGWLTNWTKSTIKEFFVNKSKNLLLPFISYSLIVLCIRYFFLPDGGMPYLLYWLHNGWEGIALWFIPVLFMSLIISKFVIGLNNNWLIVGCSIALALLGGLLSYYKIYAPWTVSSIPYTTTLVIIGYYARYLSSYIGKYDLAITILGFAVTLTISHFFRLDIAFNLITPVFLLTVGAVCGIAMIFSISSLICNKTKCITKVLQNIGQETMIILGLSQIIIIVLKEYTAYGTVVRYLMLIVALVVFKYIKDIINNWVGSKIL